MVRAQRLSTRVVSHQYHLRIANVIEKKGRNSVYHGPWRFVGRTETVPGTS